MAAEERNAREQGKAVGLPKPIEAADRSLTRGPRDFPEGTLCPSCGRFVGAYEKCPFCGAELKKRMSLVIWKRIAVFGALLGLFLMWLAAVRMEPKLIQIAGINETYNNAIVQVEGVVVKKKLTQEKGMIRFKLADQSAAIGVVGFGVLEKLKNLGNLPQVGDRINMVGQIQVSDQYGTGLFLNLPSRLKILEAQAGEEAPISKLNQSWVNSKAKVRGKVKFPPRYGKAILTDGATDLVLLLEEGNLGEKIPALKEGDTVTITGVITGSQDKLAIVPGSVEDIQMGGEVAMPEVPRKKISEISLDNMNEAVEIEGTVVKFFPFKKGGGSVTISDGSGQIGIPVFAATYDQVREADKLKVTGTRVRVRGMVGEYRGAAQVRLGSADSIIVNPGKTQASTQE